MTMSYLHRECIFCGSRDPAQHVAHIIPESLGGPESLVAFNSPTCDRCNQYFGEKVEGPALSSFPFAGYRLLAAIPSKKGRYVELPSTMGSVRAVSHADIFELLPRSGNVADRVRSGAATEFRMIAEVTEPVAVCRMLLKIDLELLAQNFYEVALSERVGEARVFARRPKRGTHWWSAIHADPSEMRMASKASEKCTMEILEKQHCLLFVMRLSGISCMVPLQEAIPPRALAFDGPYDRLVIAKC